MKVVPEITRDSIVNIINNGKRVDGRDLDEYRDIKIEPNFISKAEGSCRVTLGKTQLIVGVKPQIDSPFNDTPDLGIIMTNCELVPIADPGFEPGPPNEQSIEISRVVDRCIRESEMIDLKSLCIEEGKKVWLLFIDIHVLDYDGNLIDAALMGAASALNNTKLPKAELVDDEIVLDNEDLQDLPLNKNISMSTFVKIGDGMVVDPCLDEELVLDARISIGVTDSGEICAMQKGGDGSLTKEDILSSVKKAIELSPSIIENLGKK